jgi:outer membrane protein assembly factor BamA
MKQSVQKRWLWPSLFFILFSLKLQVYAAQPASSQASESRQSSQSTQKLQNQQACVHKLYSEAFSKDTTFGISSDSLVVANISLDGLEKSDSVVVLRELFHHNGQMFSCAKLEEEVNRLKALDLFSAVSVELLPFVKGDETGIESLTEVQIIYHLQEMTPWMLLPAGKTSDQDGLMLGLSLFHLNLAGRDIRGEVQARGSLQPLLSSKEYLLQFSSPWLVEYPVEWEAVFMRTDSWNALKNYAENSWWVKNRFIWRFWGDLGLQVASEYLLLEHDEQNLAWSAAENSFDHFLLAGLGMVWDTRDVLQNTHKGWRSEALVRQAAGDLHFQDYLLDNRVWLSHKQHILHASSLNRWRPGLESFYMRNHLGGMNSLRGYAPDSSLWAIDEHLFTLEYRYEFFGHKRVQAGPLDLAFGLQWVSGTDMALIRQNDEEYQWLNPGVFSGIHLLLPGLERIRLEVATHQPKAGEEYPLEISLALFGKSTTQRWRGR